MGVQKFSITLEVYNNIPSNMMVNKGIWIKGIWINDIKLQRKKQGATEEIKLQLNLSGISLCWRLHSSFIFHSIVIFVGTIFFKVIQVTFMMAFSQIHSKIYDLNL